MNRLRNHLPEVRTLAARSDLDTRTDSDLLDRFARYGEHAAFEVLLRRHAGVVHGVCRRMLPNPADADDAFQATFLVLVRRAGHVRGGRLGPWLYGVAVRVSLKARSYAARAAARHTEATDMIPDPTEPGGDADWLPILDAELSAVPAKYREPMVLCELQGLSRAAAAKSLGIREGTLSSRLSRGRDMLRKRLLKHGTLLPAGGLVALLAAEGRAVPAKLVERMAGLLSGAVPAGAGRLTDEVVKAMFLTKLKAVCGTALAVGLVAVGLIAASPAETPGQDKGTKSTKATPVAKAEKPKPAVGPDEKLVQGYWRLEKYDMPPKIAAGVGQRAELVKHMWLLVEGDAWWMCVANQAQRFDVKLDPNRNPKFIDALPVQTMNSVTWGLRGIYRLPDADTLEWCSGEDQKKVRPAEFASDDDLWSTVLRFKRATLPEIPAEKRAAREKLHGTWTQNAKASAGGWAGRFEFTPHFAFVPEGSDHWGTYAYDLDTEKGPNWIDLTPVAADTPDAPKPVYGVYQLGPDAGLKLALGKSGKRIARPLEFIADTERSVHTFDLTRVEGKGLISEVGK